MSRWAFSSCSLVVNIAWGEALKHNGKTGGKRDPFLEKREGVKIRTCKWWNWMMPAETPDLSVLCTWKETTVKWMNKIDRWVLCMHRDCLPTFSVHPLHPMQITTPRAWRIKRSECESDFYLKARSPAVLLSHYLGKKQKLGHHVDQFASAALLSHEWQHPTSSDLTKEDQRKVPGWERILHAAEKGHYSDYFCCRFWRCCVPVVQE